LTLPTGSAMPAFFQFKACRPSTRTALICAFRALLQRMNLA